MNRVLNRRNLRSLKSRFPRYLALLLLIVMGVYLIISIVGSAEMIIQGTEKQKKFNKVEDGQFTVFLPLTDSQIHELSGYNTVIEPIFSIDLKAEDGSTLRMFKNRKKVDLIQLDEGRQAEKFGEAVIEKGYASAHDIHTGDFITAGGVKLRITGIGSVPDYDMCIARFSDTAVERSIFGLIFTSDEQYEELKDKTDLNAEEYTYAYRLGYLSETTLKNDLKKIKIDPEQVDNKYFREIISEKLKDRHEFEDSISDLNDGAEKLSEGLNDLSSVIPELKDAAEGSAELADGTKKLKENTGELLDKVFEVKIENLTSFIPADENIRIECAAGDVVMDKNAGLVAGIIVLTLFAYVISVFVVHQIEEEQSVIGALYALGVKKKDLMLHYITLPTLISLAAAVIGSLLGFSPLGILKQSEDTYSYFSLPQFDTVYPPYLIVYALVLPPVICAVVNAIVINQKLSRTALSLMKNEQSGGSYRQFTLKTRSFPKLFAIRQMVRESRSVITIILGMFVSLMIIMLGTDSAVLCGNVNDCTVNDTKFEYQYLYKYPDKTPPEDGEAAYIETLSTDCMGYTLDVSVIGLGEKSRYFDVSVAKGKNRAVINASLAERYGYRKGDKVAFTDSSSDTDYCFTVTDVCDYSVGFAIFMDIDSMRELFGKDEDYYNVVYSDRKLDIDDGRLYSVTSKDDVIRGAGVFSKLMLPLVTTLIVTGTIVFCVVMYLMMGVMIDRSATGISLIKIFGYRAAEIRALYLNGNLFAVAAGALIALPLAKKIIDAIFPSFIPNVACTIKLAFPWQLYLFIFATILVICFIINRLLTGKINKISPAEVLKNRE